MQCLSLLTIFQGFHLKVKVSPTDDIEMLLYVIKGYKTAFKHGSFQVVEGPPLKIVIPQSCPIVQSVDYSELMRLLRAIEHSLLFC